nr:uncharacterized protein LOC107411956 [Ziziphus jujuba var. spinosa]
MEQSQPQLPCRNAPQLELVADEANAVRISQFRLVGKVFSDKLLRKNLVQSIIRRAWFTNDDVQSIADRNRIWRKRPWSINGAHLALREWKPEQSFEDLDFNISTFWVQIHGLPLQFMTSSNASTIGGLFKNLIHCESTSRTNLVGLKYMRIQVDVDIYKPLLTGSFHKLGNRGSWVHFSYERLAEFCYSYGKIGHCKQGCTIVPNAASIQDGDRYGPWIRAEAEDNRVVQEAYGLRQVNFPSKDTYDSPLHDVHQDEQDEEVHQPTRAINSVEQESDMREGDESTRIWTSSKEDHVMLQGQQQDNHQHPIAIDHVGSSSVSRKQGSDYSDANAQPTHAGKAVTRKPGKRKRGAPNAPKAQPKALKSKLIVAECCKDTDHSTGSGPVSSLTGTRSFSQEVIPPSFCMNDSNVSPLKVRLKDLGLFLIETKSSIGKMEKLVKGLPFDNHTVVEADNRAGGLALFWNSALGWTVMYKSKWIIGVRTYLPNGTDCSSWFCYCPAEKALRHSFWTELSEAISSGSEVWMCMGDFNDIIDQEEKIGGRKVTSKSNYFLRNFIANMGALDLGFCGTMYTWCNRRRGTANIRERLDRVLASPDWRILFPQAGVIHLPPAGSNHLPLKLTMTQDHPTTPRPFRFLEVWTRDPSCESIIKEAWSSSSHNRPRTSLGFKLSNTTRALKRWNKDNFGFCHTKINDLEASLSQVYNRTPSEENLRLMQSIQSEINEWRLRLELVWRQKSREVWLQAGDRNSKFFHASTISNRKRNLISALKDDNGTWLESRTEISSFLIRKFNEVFQTEPVAFCDCLDDFFPGGITATDNWSMEVLPTAEEIHNTVKRMHPIKAPGPDGMPALFFQKYWSTVGEDVVSLIQNAFRTIIFPPAINNTYMVLIPKTKQISSFNHLRPISLCNSVYKALSKLLADRIRPFLDKIISPFQAAFIPGRWIGENSILANELVHTFKQKKKGQGLVAFKIDMQKAYDRVDWGVLTRILSKLGFSHKINGLILRCISTESVELLLNGSVCGKVNMERGIRQGDPLSPFLFIIYSELLSRMLQKLEREGKIHGVKIGRTNPAISHLLFTDDILLFCRADLREMRELQKCIDQYCCWTGQRVNLAKSGCFFSKNTHSRIKVGIKKLFRMNELPKDSKYLGHQLFLGRNHSKAYDDLRKKVEARLQGWQGKLLSQADRFTLTKSVISAIPLYAMTAYKLPEKWCQGIESLASRFIWNGKQDGRRYTPIAWSKLCKPKYAGGIGLRRLKHMNLAMLSKVGWCLASDPAKLWVQALKGKYFAGSSFLRCRQKKSSSWTWCSILSARNLLSNGLCYRAGKGNQINIWEDPWIPLNPLFKPIPSHDSATNEWGMIPYTNRNLEDRLIWIGNSNGRFSVKSAYKLEFEKNIPESPWWKHLWSSKLHERLKIFMWRLANKSLPTASNLLDSNIQTAAKDCIHGCGCLETDCHIFFYCQVAKAVWFATPWNIKWDTFKAHSLAEKLILIANPTNALPVHFADKEDFFLMAVIVLDQLWKIRNSTIFENKLFSLVSTMDLLKIRFQEAKYAASKGTTPMPPPRRQMWHRPPPHFIKINSDAAIRDGTSMIGVVARDHLGEVLKIRAVSFQSDIPELAEAYGLLQGLILASEEGWTNLVCESDAKNIISGLINSNLQLTHWSAEGILNDILLMQGSFQSVVFNWVPRQSNFLERGAEATSFV